MIRYLKKIVWPLCAASLLVASCGEEEAETPKPPPAEEQVVAPAEPVIHVDTLMPPTIESYDLVLTDAVTTVPASGIESYVGETAHDYMAYGAVALASATYMVKQTPVYAEIVQFLTPVDAYGFYARLRPDGIQSLTLGTEGYAQGASLYFTAGEYAVTVSVKGDTKKQHEARSLLAHEINSRISQCLMPQFFLLFPSHHRDLPSMKYYTSRYLGVASVDSVYTISYLMEGDSAVFFLTVDLTGTKYIRLKEYARSLGEITPAPESFPFYEHSGFIFDHPDHGRIVAGVVRGKLVGIVPYRHESYELLGSLWVTGLM